MSIALKKHGAFDGKISEDTYNDLEMLHNIGSGQAVFRDDSVLLKKLRIILPDGNQSSQNKMKIAIYYVRFCTMIENLLQEYETFDEEFTKKLIDYYIQSNSIEEMNNVGLGWYYDMKFKKSTSTLYSVGYGKDSTWHDWLQENHYENNKIKERGIQSIIHACKEHINRGGQIRLKSLSKCFGVDLFKYMQLNENGIANLYVIKDAPINFIEYRNKRFALQEYLSSDDNFDVVHKPRFCLDFSHPRKQKAKNFNNWSKRFLNGTTFISQAEVDEEQQKTGIENNQLDFFLLSYLRDKHVQGGDKGISSRISPIADKEVIASDTLWDIHEYSAGMNTEICIEKCCHLTFDAVEYGQLIYSYFKKYSGSKNKDKDFADNHDSILKREKTNTKENINKLQKNQNELSNSDHSKLSEQDKKTIQEKLRFNESLINFYDSYYNFLNNIVITEPSGKIEFVLSFMDWETEEVPEDWSLQNIYTIEENGVENLKMNLYKCLCKSVASM
ncbi:hypothetical protein [Paenibacillus sp. FSL E2-0178]|uniref:hypothetical protein n=1 Tax=Paenibacillus sp. FSL E2-0178 TaxID=2921361 RepID=UPI0031591590